MVSAVERNPAQPALYPMEAHELAFRYHAAPQGRTWTIDHLSFAIRTGEVLGIVGPNGSGKSSLLKLLAGILSPERGEVRVRGIAMSSLDRREVARQVALVPQEFSQTFPFTVAETVLMGRFPHRRPDRWGLGLGAETEQDVECAHRAMAETDVLSLTGRLVSDLSGGERQRVVIARALAQEPSILLLDEPTAFLDLHHQIEMCALIRSLKLERSLTVVLVSHDLNVASLLCDRLLMLKDGRMMRMGSPDETIRSEVLRMVYGCDVVVDAHPQTGRPRVTMPVSATMG